MTLFGIKARTALALRPVNIGRVALYRLGVRLGAHPVRRLKGQLPQPPFFRMPGDSKAGIPVPEAWRNIAAYFGWWPLAVGGSAPDWHANPMTGMRVGAVEREWWRIPDFDPEAGDIKVIWEASRFDWVLAFAQRAASGDAEALARLNLWLGDWCEKNPAYCGPNWKCGQEASIRVMHLAMAALILGQASDSLPSLLGLIEAHLRRIIPTLPYATAQDNNHGTSEAAGLFIGGGWLASQGLSQAGGWERAGRRLLEERVGHLVGPDGGFSQYSLTYHRVLVDTLSMAEVWRRHLARPAFSPRWRGRAAAATQWLRALIDPMTGDGPNLGHNDGARLLPLTGADYRDFRPSVQLSMALFVGRRAYGAEGDWNTALRWLDVPLPEEVAPPQASQVFDHGGYALLRSQEAMAMLRYPRFRFRPSHADALHVDLWVRGENHLRDGGTYSYNTEPEWLRYFPGTESHNTVQFDGRDQMHRLSRFLFGDWLKAHVHRPLVESDAVVEFGAGYLDGHGARHDRVLALQGNALIVRDEIAGFSGRAVLRWRLKPGTWTLEGQTATDGRNRLSIEAGMPIRRFEIVSGWESLYYLKKEVSPVLEVEVREPGTLTTTYHWMP